MYGDTAAYNREIFSEGGSPAITHCDIQGGYTGAGNIDANPLFVSATDIHLKLGSPCFGAGTAAGAPTTDKDSRTRPNPPSIGAYENSFLFVSPTGCDSNPGSQALPFLTIQAAINASVNGSTVMVEDGTYTGPGNVDIDFNGKNITVTSQKSAASTIIDCGGTHANNHQGFYLHKGETSAIIRNLRIENGYEDTFGTGCGIDIRNTGSGTILISGCIFTTNLGNNYEGGSVFNDNKSGGTITVTGCTFIDNIATFTGGGINNENDGNGTITVTSCTFTGNSAGNSGGGIDNSNGSNGVINITNCTLTANTSRWGGGIENYNANNGLINIANCTLRGNQASVQGGGIDYFNGGSVATILTNNILYGDIGGEVSTYTNNITSVIIVSCDVQGGYAGTGNIDADPLFVSATDIHLKLGSPCFGTGTAAGAPATDKDNVTRPNPPSIGAYELTPSTHILWNNTNGAASIWNYDTGSGTFTQNTYGPYPTWTAVALANGGTDGLTRVLWDNTDGRMSVWSLDNAAGAFTQYTFGPYPGWTANALSVGTDHTTHVLWDNTDGRASLWNYNTTSGTFTQNTYGPYPGWTAKAIADGSDGKTRVLWNNSDGRMSLWQLDNVTGSFSQFTFGPYTGWTAATVSVATDNTTHILWNNANGAASLWNYDTTSGTFTQNTYGTYPGWTVKGITDGTDGKMRVLWDNTNGEMSLWSLDNVLGIFSQFTFGPYSNWTANSISH